jgi:cell surface protein SprA
MRVTKKGCFVAAILLPVFLASCEHNLNAPVRPQPPDDRLRVTIQDYEYRHFTYFFLDTLYRAQVRYYARKWVHLYDVPQVFNSQRGTGVHRIEVYRSRGGDDRDPRAIPGVAYRDPVALDSTEAYYGFFIRLQPNVDYYAEKTLGCIVISYPLGPEEVLAVAYQDSGGFYNRAPRTVGNIDYVQNTDPQNPQIIRLKLIKTRGPVPPQPPDRNHTWHLEWKNVYYLGSRNIPQEDFQVKIFFKPPTGDPQEFLIDQQSGQPISYLNVFGLDERDATGAFRPDNRIDNDPAILNLASGELIFPDLEPFEPDGVIVNGVPEISKLPASQYVSTIYRSSVQADIYRDSKFYIEVKYRE